MGVVIDGKRREFNYLFSAARCNVRPATIDIQDHRQLHGQLFRDMAGFERGYIPILPLYTGDDARSAGIEPGLKYYETRPKINWSLYFGLRLGAEALSGPVASQYEILIDVHPEREVGSPDMPWKSFRPDYRFMVAGREGRLEQEYYQVWGEGGWQGEGQADAPEFEAAVGEIYECLIPWASIGTPLVRSIPYARDRDPAFLLYALRSCQGDTCDYVPSFRFSNNGEVTGARIISYDDAFINDEVVWTVITRRTWGRVKQSGQKVEGSQISLEERAR